MLMNDKIMFDRYYCINSKKTEQNIEKMFALFILQPYHHFLTPARFFSSPEPKAHKVSL